MSFLRCLKLIHRIVVALAAVTVLLTVPTSSVSAAEQSQTQPAALQKIDSLLGLIDQRLAIAAEVAKSKWNSGGAVDDPEREKQLLEAISVQAKAMAANDLTFISNFFQNQFDAGKIIQTRLLMHWLASYPDDYKFNDAPDLMKDIRPKLERLNPELISALLEVQPLLNQAAMRSYLSTRAGQIIRNDVNGEARRTALTTLLSE